MPDDHVSGGVLSGSTGESEPVRDEKDGEGKAKISEIRMEGH